MIADTEATLFLIQLMTNLENTLQEFDELYNSLYRPRKSNEKELYFMHASGKKKIKDFISKKLKEQVEEIGKNIPKEIRILDDIDPVKEQEKAYDFGGEGFKKDLPTQEACQQLKEWGCDVESKYEWIETYVATDYEPMIGQDIVPKGQNLGGDDHQVICPAYNLRDIICDPEMAKKFFGERRYITPAGIERSCSCLECGVDEITGSILRLLHQNKEEEAEKYLLENCIFNPKNKS